MRCSGLPPLPPTQLIGGCTGTAGCRMISQRDKGEFARFYTVSDPKKHQKGYTVYKVTGRIISRKNPEDVQEVIVWKRYSDFRKLHKELWQIHKNLHRQPELFPPFAKAKVFGRFDEVVIEERRQCSEDLLQFSANIPALFNSEHFDDFFKGGEVHDGSELIGPAEPFSDFLADSLSDCSSEVTKDLSALSDVTATSHSECGGFSSDSDLISLLVDTDSLAELDDGMASARDSPVKQLVCLSPSSESINKDLLRNEPEMRRDGAEGGSRASVFPGIPKPKTQKKDYLEKAGEQIKLALQKEAEQDFEGAFSFYRSGVDLLLQGVQGETSPLRREAVKRKTAEYLMRAEQISTQHLKTSSENGSYQVKPPGLLSSRPTWNLRSPAEELKVFRVLGVIDKVLLIMDKRTQETFILKGLRKSSECSRNKKTIIPHCVPNMVRLHKYIISEDSIFLVLQHAEGGKLWSYLSNFLKGSTEESFPMSNSERPLPVVIHGVDELIPDTEDTGSSIESGEQNPGNTLQVLPMKTSLTPVSQDDSSIVDDDGGLDSSHGLLDSDGTSEEECTNSYLTLCNEYEQEKIEPDSLSEEPLLVAEPPVSETKEAATCSRAHSFLSNDSLCSPISAQELQFFTDDANFDMFSPSRTTDSLMLSKKSPMEFFRIDSKDSASELLVPDSAEKVPNLKMDLATGPPFLSVSPGDTSSGSTDALETGAFTDFDRESNESVPVISFKDAASEDTGSCDEGRPDLLVNLPGVSSLSNEQTLAKMSALEELKETVEFGKPDVLQLSYHLGPEMALGGTIKSSGACNEKLVFDRFNVKKADCLGDRSAVTNGIVGDHDTGLTYFASQEGGSGALDLSKLSGGLPDELEKKMAKPTQFQEGEHPHILLFTEEFGSDGKGEESERKRSSDEGAGQDKDLSQIFRDLDELLVLASQAHIPEVWIRHWAVELVVALDALHQEGIVCRDLNPNNILLNDRGHIQLTYFSRWSEVEDSCDSSAIDRMYCAPEIGSISEETEACDWWSLGAILFELLCGKSLYQCHPAGINRHTVLIMPDYVSDEAKSLVQQLLQFNPTERLGAGAAGVEDIKSHPFFAHVNWPA
ncbi:ribosomal protein S6 kinase delta-1 [Polypterus senegalus]|uniref:ribosomal protein S6 kinase delta-1 n=1 Tax=Polypterus senegalus TaxID=55291 RepID=UPI0019633F09|nr:ribosomal protein S6 kinase delta-1 [Polypterus senegalus]